MKFGIRTPSLTKRIAARTSVKRVIRHSLGLKAPRGWGWVTNPKRAAYNRIYHRTTVGCVVFVVLLVLVIAVPVFAQTARITGMYHEANCPTVDPQRMTRMKRGAAEAIGLIPAPDCQPGARFRYLGTSSGGYSPYTAAAANSTDSPTAVHVRAHMRDGSYVHEYDRSRPQRD